MTRESMNGEQQMWVAIVLTISVLFGFCLVQFIGCLAANNAKIVELGKRGIRAETGPNGEIKILDTRDYKEAEAK